MIKKMSVHFRISSSFFILFEISRSQHAKIFSCGILFYTPIH